MGGFLVQAGWLQLAERVEKKGQDFLSLLEPMVISAGKPGDFTLLANELQAIEFPKGRKTLSEIASKEKFV